MIYVVERYLPGMASVDLDRGLLRLHAVCRLMRAEGTEVRYLGSTIVPADETCLSHFEAPSADAVAVANRRAGLAFDRIREAVATGGERRGEVPGEVPGEIQASSHSITGGRP
ncbi:MAG: nickel-binding protein [Candidatus Limnocylindria bacterium]